MEFANKTIHFIGIGGAGVSGLARVALEAGASVSGSDLKASPITQALEEQGARVSIGQRAENLPRHVDFVVATAAVRAGNPELDEARQRGLCVMKYAQALGELTRGRVNICVAGTHGKTSTTSMLAQILRGQGAGWIVGGEPLNLEASACWGSAPHFVMESCEYDRSFLHLHPSLVLLNNIEADHLDVYGDIEGVERGFADFVARLPRHGTLLYNADDPRCVRVARQAHCRRVSFGQAEGADWRLIGLDASSGFAQAEVSCQGERMGALHLNVPGQVYAFNALGALAAAHWAGCDSARALEALREYRGVKRRFEMLGRFKGAPVIDDYAHHPSAVKQLLQAARDTFASRRLVAVFQAHQYQRLNGFFEEFVHALALADRVLVMRTYAAREQGVIPGIPEQALCRELQALGVDALALENFDLAAAELDASTGPSDALVFIGAGDVNEIALELLANQPCLTRSAA